MTYTAPAKFPVLREMLLLEGPDDDITAGLRTVLQHISANWRTPDADLKKMEKQALKKLSSTDRSRLKTLMEGIVTGLISNPTSPPNMDHLATQVSGSKEMASAAVIVLMVLGSGAKRADQRFLALVETKTDVMVTQEELNAMTNSYGNLSTFKLGPGVLQFIQEARQKFEKLMTVNDDIQFQENAIAEKLSTLLDNTTNADVKKNKKAAILGVHYFMHHLWYMLTTASTSLGQKLQSSGTTAVQAPPPVEAPAPAAPLTAP